MKTFTLCVAILIVYRLVDQRSLGKSIVHGHSSRKGHLPIN